MNRRGAVASVLRYVHYINTLYTHYINTLYTLYQQTWAWRGGIRLAACRVFLCLCQSVRLFVSLPILSPSLYLYLSLILPLPLTLILPLPLPLTLTLPLLSFGARPRVCRFVYPLSLTLTRSSTL
jgi:hypothetical protein